jgi:hypothetical protein
VHPKRRSELTPPFAAADKGASAVWRKTINAIEVQQSAIP